MKKLLFFFFIGAVFLILSVVVQSSFLSIGMDEEEIVEAAVCNTFMQPSYQINGYFYLTGFGPAPFEILIDGSVNDQKKYFKLGTTAMGLDKEGDLLGYYKEENRCLITTPIEGYRKLLFDDTLSSRRSDSNYDAKNLLAGVISQVIKGKSTPLLVQSEGLEYYTLTDSYTMMLELQTLQSLIDTDVLKGFNHLFLDSEQPIKVQLYIDRELQIRCIEAVLELESKTIKSVLKIDDFDEDLAITIPDMSDAINMEMALSRIVAEWMEEKSDTINGKK